MTDHDSVMLTVLIMVLVAVAASIVLIVSVTLDALGVRRARAVIDDER